MKNTDDDDREKIDHEDKQDKADNNHHQGKNTDNDDQENIDDDDQETIRMNKMTPAVRPIKTKTPTTTTTSTSTIKIHKIRPA